MDHVGKRTRLIFTPLVVAGGLAGVRDRGVGNIVSGIGRGAQGISKLRKYDLGEGEQSFEGNFEGFNCVFWSDVNTPKFAENALEFRGVEESLRVRVRSQLHL
jgi:hypothetical protein